MPDGYRGELPEFSRYTFGAMSLGRDPLRLDEDIKVARAAMDAGVWFHTSQEYGLTGGTFMVLRSAFDEARSQVPPCMFKIRCDSARLLRFDVEDALRRLNLPRIDVAQLVMSSQGRREIVYDILARGPLYDACCDLKQRGLVGHFVMEVFGTFSADALHAVQNDLFDAYILYYNLLDRQASNALCDEFRTRGTPLLSLRTFSAGMLDPGAAATRRTRRPEDPLPARRDEIAPLFDRSACRTWLEFAMRFILSVPGVRTTIGGTSSLEHLRAYLAAARDFKPLEPTLVDAVLQLHRKWMS